MGTEKRARQKANRQLRYQEEARLDRRRSTTRRILIGALIAVGAVAGVIGIAALGGIGGDDDEPSEPIDTAVASTVATPSTGATPSTVATPSTGATPSTVATPSTGATPSTVAGPGTTVDSTTPAPEGFAYGTGACPPDEVSEPTKSFSAAPQLCIDPGAAYTATIVTSEGDIVVDLDTDGAPGTVNNFVTLARWGFFDDTAIFRAADGIDIIQGGGLTNSDPFGYTIPDEGSGYTYDTGVLAMANTGAPNSAGAQWFLGTGPDVAGLDQLGTYVVFGEIVEGLDVAQAIQALGQPDESLSSEVTVDRIEIAEA